MEQNVLCLRYPCSPGQTGSVAHPESGPHYGRVPSGLPCLKKKTLQGIWEPNFPSHALRKPTEHSSSEFMRINIRFLGSHPTLPTALVLCFLYRRATQQSAFLHLGKSIFIWLLSLSLQLTLSRSVSHLGNQTGDRIASVFLSREN